MIIVNTGNGKGKTTAAIGQIIRSLGRGWKVCLIQLFKGRKFYGEQKILAKLQNLDFYSFAPKHPFCFPGVSSEEVAGECQQALRLFDHIVEGRKRYQLIVLEEFNIALRDGYITLKDLFYTLDKADSRTHVLVTGRGAPAKLIRKADMVTEMKEIKHPFKKGISAQKGLEF
jgi:cob(I)alamin adenosyltransferase